MLKFTFSYSSMALYLEKREASSPDAYAAIHPALLDAHGLVAASSIHGLVG